MRLIFVDVEGKGPAAGLNDDTRFEWGAVDYDTRQTFHRIGATEQHFKEFNEWLKSLSLDDRFVFVTDNVAYDWQFINHYFHRFLGFNPFGHSARRIGDFYAGLKRDFRARQEWKKLRVTKHTHHPVDDAMGNVEAFERLDQWAEMKRTEEEDIR